MVTIAGQPFKFQNVPPEDVFPTIGFMAAMTLFLANQTSLQELPRKLVLDRLDRVISNNNIHDWIKFSAPVTFAGAGECQTVCREQQHLTQIS